MSLIIRNTFGLILILIVGLTSCSVSTLNTNSKVDNATEFTITTEIPVSETIISPTAITEVLNIPIIFWSNGYENQELVNTILSAFLDFEEINSIDWLEIPDESLDGSISPQTKVVFSFENNNKIENIKESNPQMLVVYLNTTEIYEGNTISIGFEGSTNHLSAFMAGYLAALDSEQWRIGAIVDESEEKILEVFTNGVKYLCGLCIPAFPPFENYPLSYTVNHDSDESAIIDLIGNFLANGIEIIYLSPNIVTNEILNYANNNEIKIVINTIIDSNINPYANILVEPNWKTVIDEVLLNFFENNEGENLYSPLDFNYQMNTTLSQGKLKFLEKMVEPLSFGKIDINP